VTACQRWRDRQHSWRRPEDGGFDARRYWVTDLPDPQAKAFVTGHHYSGSYVSARLRWGMWEATPAGPLLVGVAVASVPTSRAVLIGTFPGLEPYTESLELGRFVLLDRVPANGESWFYAEVRRLAYAAGLRGIVSFSDPVPRRAADGTQVMPGHVGVIYQASGGLYCGRSTAHTEALMPDGRIFPARAAQKIRAREQGHAYAQAQLVAYGARPMQPGERPAAWLAEALNTAGARKHRHPGKHRYAFPLGPNARTRALVAIGHPTGPYPKAAQAITEQLTF
jgi:hypothetical protein